MQVLLVPDSGEDGGYVAVLHGNGPRKGVLLVRYGEIRRMIYLTPNPDYQPFFRPKGVSPFLQNHFTPETWVEALRTGDPAALGALPTNAMGGMVRGYALMRPGSPDYEHLIAMFEEPS